ncbi:unnamed protein product, partial [Rotaria magnacalcarata]
MLALFSLKVSTPSDERFARSAKLEAVHGCPNFIFIPHCTLEYGLQCCVDTLK